LYTGLHAKDRTISLYMKMYKKMYKKNEIKIETKYGKQRS